MKTPVTLLFAVALHSGYAFPGDTNSPARNAQTHTSSAPRWASKMPRWDEWVIVQKLKEDLAESLQQCLVVVSNRLVGLPHLPVGGYSTKQGDRPVWIIVVKWEWEGGDEKMRPSAPMVHTQVFAFDSQKRSIIGFTSCN